MTKSKHDKISENLAKRFGGEYKKQKGIDIVTRDRVIEVEPRNRRKGLLKINDELKKIEGYFKGLAYE